MLSSLFHTIRFVLQHPLNRKAPFKALGRLLNWQRRAPAADPVICPFVNDTRFYAARGWTGVTGNIYCGLHEFEEMAFVLHVLNPADLFIDAGANMGTYSILAAGVCHTPSIAVEPVSSTYDRLQDNMRLNDIGGLVQTIQAGLAAKEGVARFHTGKGTMNSISTDPCNGVKIVVRTLDELLQGQLDRDLVLLKLDVEGYESAVLEGADQLLRNPVLKAVIMEVNGSGNAYGFSDEATHRQLTAYDFLPYTYDPFERRLQPLASFGPYNTIYLREPDFIMERIRKAAVFKVLDQQL